MNEKVIHNTWDILFRDRAPAYLGTPYMLHWFASRPDGTARMGDYAMSPAELVKAVLAAEKQEMNFYVQLNPSVRRDGVRNRAEDVTHWNYHLLDLDPGANAEPLLALEEVLRFYHHRLGVVLKPHIIFSGRGVQAWVPFYPPIPTSEPLRLGEWEGKYSEVINRVQSYWLRLAEDRVGNVHGCRLDPAVADLPRVMRMPGTVNVKSGKEAAWIKEGTPSHTLAHLLVSYADTKAVVPPALPEWMPGRTWQFYVPLTNWSAHRYLTVGGDQGTRHDMAVKAAKNLYELGCEEEQAQAALAWGNRLSAPEPLSSVEMEQILRSVYGRRRSVV